MTPHAKTTWNPGAKLIVAHADPRYRSDVTRRLRLRGMDVFTTSNAAAVHALTTPRQGRRVLLEPGATERADLTLEDHRGDEHGDERREGQPRADLQGGDEHDHTNGRQRHRKEALPGVGPVERGRLVQLRRDRLQQQHRGWSLSGPCAPRRHSDGAYRHQ